MQANSELTLPRRTSQAWRVAGTVLGVVVGFVLTAPCAATTPGEIWIEPVTRMEFVWVPRGCALIGSPDDELGRLNDEGRYEVCVEGYWLGKYEVTNV